MDMQSNGRVLAQTVLAALAVVGPATLLGGIPAVRAVVTVPVLLLAPGAAVLGFFSVRDTLTELLLTVVTSVGILVLITQVQLAVDRWAPELTFAIVSELSAIALVVHARRAGGGALWRDGASRGEHRSRSPASTIDPASEAGHR